MSQPQARKRHNQGILFAIISVVLIITATTIAVTAFNNSNNNTSNNQQHVVVPPPANFQTGILVNNVNQTFPFDYEWPFRLAQGVNYTVRIILTGGIGVNAVWARIDQGSNLLRPWLNSATLNSTNPMVTWTGKILISSGYKLELGNLADENNMASVEVYIAAD